MIEVPRRQTCACGNGCDGRSSVKWNGYLVVTCVPDDEAMGVVEAIMEAARRSIAEERAAVVAFLREQVASATLYRVDDVSVDAASAGVAMLLAHVANAIERGEHRRGEGG